MEDYKEKYNKLVESIKVLQETNPSDEGLQNWVYDNVPELAESGDENIRKRIYNYINVTLYDNESAEKEKWLAWLEKVKNFDKQLEQAYKNSDEVQYRRGYDKGYMDGYVMGGSMEELEKQGEMPTTISVDKMVEEFIDARIEANGICQIIESDAYRKGIVDTLSKILIKEEKPITIGSKKAEGKLGEMIAASKEPAGSGEDKELSHKEVAKKSDQDDKWKWNENDEKFVKENIYIKLGSIDEVNDELYSKIIDWISLIKRRLS